VYLYNVLGTMLTRIEIIIILHSSKRVIQNGLVCIVGELGNRIINLQNRKGCVIPMVPPELWGIIPRQRTFQEIAIMTPKISVFLNCLEKKREQLFGHAWWTVCDKGRYAESNCHATFILLCFTLHRNEFYLQINLMLNNIVLYYDVSVHADMLSYADRYFFPYEFEEYSLIWAPMRTIFSGFNWLVKSLSFSHCNNYISIINKQFSILFIWISLFITHSQKHHHDDSIELSDLFFLNKTHYFCALHDTLFNKRKNRIKMDWILQVGRLSFLYAIVSTDRPKSFNVTFPFKSTRKLLGELSLGICKYSVD
jgi:hypothetical protein